MGILATIPVYYCIFPPYDDIEVNWKISINFSEAGIRPPDADFETAEVLVQCEEEDEEDEDEDEDEEVAAVDQEEGGVSTLAYQCSVCRHLPPPRTCRRLLKYFWKSHF